MSGEARFVGEGRLGWRDTLGGKGALFPIAAGLLGVSAMAASDRFAWFAIGLGALVPLWFAWRRGVPQALVRALRRGRPAFRVELDDLGVRTFDLEGKPTSQLEWFELQSFWIPEHGIVLMMRLPKNGVNAVFVPREFFSADAWPRIVALVREKLPGSAQAEDRRVAALQAQQQRSWPRAIAIWGLLLVLWGGVYWWLRSGS